MLGYDTQFAADHHARAHRRPAQELCRRTRPLSFGRCRSRARHRPCGPYSLRLSARLATDATRTFRSGRLSVVLPGGELACAWQHPDGVVVVRAESEAGIERMRFVLGLDDDHSEFLERFAHDPVIGRATRVLKGLRPLRLRDRRARAPASAGRAARHLAAREGDRAGCDPAHVAASRLRPVRAAHR